MKTEFKEKTYEKYFGYEVARMTNVTFSPDQCDEAFLGFDDAFEVAPSWLMRHTPFVRGARWARMIGIGLHELDHVGKELSRRLPPFRFNLFVQYKRPVFLTSRGAREWSHWQSPYFRYDTTPHQQDLLEKIETQSRGRAATVYASPAFWKANDLWTHQAANTVIDNSNVASVGRLRRHHHYSYAAPGFQGKGHSEAEDVESTALKEQIARGLEGEAVPLNRHLKQTAKLIAEVVQTSAAGASLFGRVRSAIDPDSRDDGSLVSALATIEAFSDAFGTSFYALG